MSTFSEYNGPGGSNAALLFEIQDLQKQINDLSAVVTALRGSPAVTNLPVWGQAITDAAKQREKDLGLNIVDGKTYDFASVKTTKIDAGNNQLALNAGLGLDVNGDLYLDGYFYEEYQSVTARDADASEGEVTSKVHLFAAIYEKDTSSFQARTCRAYITYTDSIKWSAIIDAVVVPETTQTVIGPDGVPYAATLPSKGDIRVIYAHPGNVERRWGIFKGTSTSLNAVNRYYLGWYDSPEAPGNPTLRITGNHITPISSDPEVDPNGTVQVVPIISDNTIYADNYKDLKKNNVLITDHDKQTLTLGTTPKQLILNSRGRPDVFMQSGNEQMAFLTDIMSNIFWMTEVAVVGSETGNLAELNSPTSDIYRVTVDSTGKVITWDPTGTIKRGVYTSPRDSYNATGYVFRTGDKALIRKQGGKSPPLPDGYYAGVFGGTGTRAIDRSLIRYVDEDYIKTTLDSTTSPNGTTLVDDNGAIGKVRTWTASATEVYVPPVSSGTIVPLTYTLPIYAVFDDLSQIWIIPDTPPEYIAVPGTFDGEVHDSTYEWGGYTYDDSNGFHVMSNIMWTAHYENHTSMNYKNEWPWSIMQLNPVNITVNFPLGSITNWAEAYTTIPDGWLRCNGATITRSQYPDLYDLIGDKFGGVGRLPVQTNAVIRSKRAITQ
jgi:hypothetical protein